MKLTPYVKYLMQFAMPDQGGTPGGGGGGGGKPPPPAPGKGTPAGNAPPAPKIEPADHAEPVKTDAMKEIEGFVPPSLDDIDIVDPNPVPPPKPPEAKPPAAKPGEEKPPAAPKPGEVKNPEDDPKLGAAPLRKELATVRAERDELKKKAEAGDPKVSTLTAENTELKSVQERIVKENDELRQKLAFHDPSTSAELGKIDKEFDVSFENKTKLMPKIRPVIGGLVAKFRSIPADKYEEGLEALETEVAGLVGEKRATDAMRLIQEGAEFAEKREAMMKDLRTNGLTRQGEAQQKQFDDGIKAFKEDISGALDAPEDLKQQHPFHPLAFLQNTIAGLDETGKAKLAEFEESVDRYTAYAAQGLSPKVLAEFDKMPVKEREAAIKEFNDKRRGAIALSRKMIKRAYFYEKFFTGFLKNYSAMQEKLQKLTGGQPPDPTKGRTPGGGNGDDDLSKFKTPSVADL